MSARSLAWAKLALWRLGTGWTLGPMVILLPVTYFQSALYLTGSRLRAVDGTFGKVLLTVAFLLLFFAWVVIAVRHVRAAVDTWQLRVPGCPRTLLLSACSLAAWSVLGMSALLLPWQLTIAEQVEAIAQMVALGCLGALVDLWPWLIFLLILTSWAPAIGDALNRPINESFQAGVLLLVAWRLWSLAHRLRRGSYPALLQRGWYVDGDEGPLLWRARPFAGCVNLQLHSLPDAMRIMLGPLFAPRAVWPVLCLAALPVALLADRVRQVLGMPELAVDPDLWRTLLLVASYFGAWWFRRRAQRLATFLYEPQAESVELALLPGLGSMKRQRQALLMQALIRPLTYGGLCFVGLVAGYWGLLHIGRARPELIVNDAVCPLVVLLLYVSLSLGVASGRLSPTNTWLRPSWAVIVLLPAGCTPLPGYGAPVNVVTVFCTACLLLVLAWIATYMIADTWRLRRLAWVRCQ